MYPSIETIKTILLKESYISPEDSKAAEAESRDGAEYIDFLIRHELLTKALLGQALAESYGIPFADLGVHTVTKEHVAKIPEALARENRVVFVKASEQIAAIATDRPEKVDQHEIAKLFKGKKVKLAYTLPEYIDASFALYQQPLATRFSEIIKNGQRVAPEIVDEIIHDAATYRASDIHFEPQPAEVMVRFRIDGNLREAGVLPKEYYENVLNRIKVESGMRIDEHLTAQDGSMHRQLENITLDLRVSLVPTVQGEKVVMRVLGSYVQGLSLSDIGLNDTHREMIDRYAAKPFGMILTTGPTGSGKTTTLYALLKLLNKSNINITTIEDPVEYKMIGTNQIQVSQAANITFAQGLRAIVRQDPDIILVGEIRDQETAEISVNAALTGHLLLSTFHANDAATAIPRLIELGVEPFLVASTLEVVIAQRLVRKICTKCRYGISVQEALTGQDASLAEYFGKNDTLYTGRGCEVCNGTGYSGRIALFELIPVTPEIQDLVLRNPSSKDIAALAHKQGNSTMFEDGIEKIKSGYTTIDEVLRVVEAPSKGSA